MPATATVKALEQASKGLLYQSETDAPWTVFSWPTAAGEPTGEEVRKRGRHKPSAPVEEKTLDEFFTPLVEDKDWYGDEEKAVSARYRSLRAVVAQQLTGAKVVRVGATKVTVYIVGVANEGGWAGLKTTAVET